MTTTSVLTHGAVNDLQVVAFDAYGTLFNVYAVSQAAEHCFAGKGAAVAQLWRDKQLEYSRLRALAGPGRYVSFWQITMDALEFVDRSLGLSMSDSQRQTLLDAYAQLSAYPEVAEVLVRLKESGRRLCILSNGDPQMLDKAIAASGLREAFQAVLSVHDLKTFKVSPQAYQLVLHEFGVQAHQACLVSSNAWDVCGARWAGLQAFWVNRQQLPMDVLGVSPSAEGRDLRDFVDWLNPA
jgi:2-haloacid dehalogenase